MRDGTRTREAIRAAALTLFAEKGVEAASVRDIARAAGVAEGALYRHFPSKDALARDLFLNAYAELATDVLAAAGGKSLLAAIPDVVSIFCRLFDENHALFAFLLLQQHSHLAAAPSTAQGNAVEAVRSLIAAAMARGEIAPGDPDLCAAMALGIVMQPAIFILYGRIQGPLVAQAQRIAQGVERVLFA